jgi:pimeloyl-ACP methyl ester carboxylesterase
MARTHDANVKAAVAHWAPRFIQNGVDYNDFVATTARISAWEEWLPEWSRTADKHAEIAEEAESAGHTLTAGHAWRRASVTRHFGKFVWTVDLDRAAEETLRAVTEMRHAHRLLDRSAIRIEAHFDGSVVAANLRRPPDVPDPPLVVLVPGLDSTKEEFFFLEQSFLDRGMATLSIDGPGQGETGLQIPIRGDYHLAVIAVLDELASSGEMPVGSLDRVGLAGVSLGGLYAPLVAANEPRIRALVGISGPFTFTNLWADLPQISKAAFTARVHAKTEQEALGVAALLDLTGVCERITAESLYVTGDRDRLVPWQETERQANETPHATFICYEGGNHGVSNLPHVARPMIADWMADKADSWR